MTTNPEHQGAGVYYRKITEQEINNLDALFSNGNVDQQTASQQSNSQINSEEA